VLEKDFKMITDFEELIKHFDLIKKTGAYFSTFSYN